tara:strand:+ start:88573 stop:88995 length:423 start_codon:yes stop_codon:yes gene_type:complete
MKINIVPIEKKHMNEVINILQSISKFQPLLEDYNKIWENFNQISNSTGIIALNQSKKVVGYGSIIFEYKIRGGIMGHIEDIAVHKDFNRMGIGNAIMDYLLNLAQEKNCYKISLSCHKNNIDFYKKFYFIENGFTLTKFL